MSHLDVMADGEAEWRFQEEWKPQTTCPLQEAANEKVAETAGNFDLICIIFLPLFSSFGRQLQVHA